MHEGKKDYRTRLYDVYVSTHFRHIRDISLTALEKQARTFRHYYGPLLPRDKNARILDVGCGYGAFLYFLKTEGYRNIEGVDISQEQIDTAKKLGLDNVVCEDALSFLQARPETYDCIVAIDFLEHFSKEEVLDILHAIFQALKPGGRLIIQTPNADGPFAGRYRYCDFTHEFALTATSARQILEAVGFRKVQIFAVEPFVHSVPSLFRVLIWKVIKLLLCLYLAAETGVIRGHILTQNLIAVAYKIEEK